MNNIMIKANNVEEYNKTLVILGNLGVTWGNGRTINVKDYEAGFHDPISFNLELNNILEEKEGIKEDKSVVCLIVEHNKLFWDWLKSIVDNCFDYKDYEMYSFKEFEKVYNI